MIISQNNTSSLEEFKKLMRATDFYLNQDAMEKSEYYKTRTGNKLELDVYNALSFCARGTQFENTIKLVSGNSFPDIIANRYFGVEVKSTIHNHWKTIGGSILESTRDPNVERIFLTFGKLCDPISFISKPYESCLYDISVTHYPRYQIDMQLEEGQTIFEKIGISYDELRLMKDPIEPISKYYRSNLKPGQSLWWARDKKVGDNESPPVLKLWTSLSPEEKLTYTYKGYALFPEVFSSSQAKYHNFAFWLATTQSILNTNIRDQFSAGGKISIKTENNLYENMPAIYGRVSKYIKEIKNVILNVEIDELMSCWETKSINIDRIEQWCKLVAMNASTNKGLNETTIYLLLTQLAKQN